MSTIEKLNEILEKRKKDDPKKSYTSFLLKEGAEMCCKKLGEESVELIIATLGNNKEEMKNEAADLIYHLLVLLKSKNVDIDETYKYKLLNNSLIEMGGECQKYYKHSISKITGEKASKTKPRISITIRAFT